ncbi:MAG: hypothetical protein ABSC13_08410 [Dehalococcoidia bacterium]|jgi:hypothetical protein
MTAVAPFYSINEANKPATERVHHNNGACAAGQDIRQADRRAGDGGYRLCDDCKELNRLGK